MGKGSGSCDTEFVLKRPRRRLSASLPPVPIETWQDVEVTALERFVYDEETEEYPEFTEGEMLRLARDADNPVDASCIMVFRARDMLRMGYLARTDNGPIAEAIDNGRTVKAHISRVEGPQRSENNQLRWRAGRVWANVSLYSR